MERGGDGDRRPEPAAFGGAVETGGPHERPLERLGGGVNQAGGRAYNERLTLSLIRLNGPLPKAVLARLTGLSAQTLSQIIRRLEADGLVLPQEPLRGRIGQPSVPYALNPRGVLSFGVKIDGGAAMSSCAISGAILARGKLAYAYPVPDRVLAFVGDAVRRRHDGGDKEPRIAGVGIAMPFEIWKWADEVEAPVGLLDGWRTLDVAREVERATGLPAYLANDATAACGAELAYGYGGSSIDLLYAFIGSFVGGGLVLNGRLIEGRAGNAGAIGSMPVRLGERTTQLIHHASLITLEKALSKTGIDPSVLQEADGDWSALGGVLERWIATTADALALAVVGGASVVDVEHVCIDGAVPRFVLQRIVDATARSIDALDTQGLSPFTLHKGHLGSDARALGGAMLPIQAQYGSGRDVILKTVAADP